MIKVTTQDTETGEEETMECPDDSYILVTGPRCELTHKQVFSGGTHQLTIKPVKAAQ